jgi:AcrR family transcriptional regulator
MVYSVYYSKHCKLGYMSEPDSLMTLNHRERVQQATREAIKATGRRQMAHQGAASLSLRAIAAEMGLTAPALYRYYKNRDELVTALIVDSFHALGDALEVAGAACAPADFPGQYIAMMAAYRTWALANRADFTLIYGTPLPDYHAPREVTVPAVLRSTAPLTALLVRAWREGQLAVPDSAPLPESLHEHFVAFAADYLEAAVPPALLHVAIAGWAHLQGLIMLEVFGHLEPTVGDPATFYALAVQRELARLGLRGPT